MRINLNYLPHNKDSINSISANYTWSFFEDKSGNMWIGTFAGLNRFIEDKEVFKDIF